jgi:hypothetical protein
VHETPVAGAADGADGPALKCRKPPDDRGFSLL